jgi:tRNA(fMet)-specific endonuclease VapC
MRYLLDTNAWIALLRGSSASLRSEFRKRPPDEIVFCSVVVAELRYGVEKSASPYKVSNQLMIEKLFAKHDSIPFDDNAARRWSTVRAGLAKAGMPIGPNDLMIASIALANSLTLVTHNLSEFQRIFGLSVVDWQT